MRPLTPKESAFVHEYLVDLNATQAAIRAHYAVRSARQAATRLLSKVHIREAINELKKQRIQRIEVKQDDVLRELLRIMNTDISAAFDENGNMRPLKDIPEDLRRAISSVEVEQSDEGGAAVKLKLWDKLRSIELLGKHLKMFTDKTETTHSFADLTDEQLEARKQEIIAREKK